MLLSRKLIPFVFILCTSFAHSQTVFMEEHSEVEPFAGGLLTREFSMFGKAFFTFTLYSMKLEKIGSTHEEYPDGRRFSYEIACNRLIVEVFGGNEDESTAYIYDSTLKLISKRTFTKEQQKARRTVPKSTEEFSMARYRQQKLSEQVGSLVDCDVLTKENKLLYLDCDRDNLSWMAGTPLSSGKPPVEDGEATAYLLAFGEPTGDFAYQLVPVWKTRLPVKCVLDYHFLLSEENVLFLQVMYLKEAKRMTVFYRMDPETGKIMQSLPVQLNENATPYISATCYDSKKDELLIFGNYQDAKIKLKDQSTFTGYFLQKIQSETKTETFQVPFASEFSIENMHGFLLKNPFIVGSRFIESSPGEFKLVGALAFYPERGGVRCIALAGIIVATFSNKEFTIYPFENYTRDNYWGAFYNLTYMMLNKNAAKFGGLCLESEKTANGYTFYCTNSAEGSLVGPRYSVGDYSLKISGEDAEMTKMKVRDVELGEEVRYYPNVYVPAVIFTKSNQTLEVVR